MEALVARQPIFDPAGNVAGYELLYRGSREARTAEGATAQMMSGQVIAGTLLAIGLDRVTDGQPAYFNCSREMLLDAPLELLEPERCVLEILETVPADDDVIAACRRLVEHGHRLALDDFDPDGGQAALLPYASIVKLDVAALEADALRHQLTALRRWPLQLLAEKVETQVELQACRALGFDLFQGYAFSRPELLSAHDLTVHRAAVMRVLPVALDPLRPDGDVEAAFRGDIALTYKLLRIANSAALGGRGIRSIPHAIRMLGRERLARWLALLLLGVGESMDGPNRELVRGSLVRARLCELAAHAGGTPARAGSAFLVGLFSQLDSLLGRPMDDAVELLRLSGTIAAALRLREGVLAPFLELADGWERAEWCMAARAADHIGVPIDRLAVCYVDALDWSAEQLSLS